MAGPLNRDREGRTVRRTVRGAIGTASTTPRKVFSPTVKLNTAQVRDMRTPKPVAKGRVLAVTRGSAQAKKVGLRRQLAGEKARGYNQRARATISHLDTLAKQGVGLPLGAGAGGAARLASRALAGRIILPPVTARGLLPAAAIASGKLLQNVYRDSVEMPKRAAVAKKTIAARRHRARQRTKSG